MSSGLVESLRNAMAGDTDLPRIARDPAGMRRANEPAGQMRAAAADAAMSGRLVPAVPPRAERELAAMHAVLGANSAASRARNASGC